MRNEELGAAHGQGASRNVIPPALAELAVHLSGVINIFLIKRYLEKLAEEGTEDNGEDGSEEEIVF